MRRFTIWVLLMLSLNACSLFSDKPVEAYQLERMRHLQALANWAFEGRVALSNEKDSISAAISWRHNAERDEIELSGPLAQGRVAISVTAEKVVVDDGENRREYSGRVDEVVSEQLGVDMPVSSLRYWVLGVNEPLQTVVEQGGGFLQNGWQVSYRELQRLSSELLPKRMSVEKNKTRIKLIIDQWTLS
jgi:outer membrane lipoprotein LolB